MESCSYDEARPALAALGQKHKDLVALLRESAGKDASAAQRDGHGSLQFLLGEMLTAIVDHASATGIVELSLTYEDMAVLCRTKVGGKSVRASSLQALFSATYPATASILGPPVDLGGGFSVVVEVTGTRTGKRGRPEKRGPRAGRGLRLGLVRHGVPVQVTSLPEDAAAHPFYAKVEALKHPPTPEEQDEALRFGEVQAARQGNAWMVATFRAMRQRLRESSTATVVAIIIAVAASTAALAYGVYHLVDWLRSYRHPQTRGMALPNPPVWGVEHTSFPIEQTGCVGRVDGYLDSSRNALFVFTPTDCPSTPKFPSARWQWSFTEPGRDVTVITDQPTVIHQFVTPDPASWSVAVWPQWYTEHRGRPFSVDDTGLRLAPSGQDAAFDARPLVPSGSTLKELARRLVPDAERVAGGNTLPATITSIPADGSPCSSFVGLVAPLAEVLDAQVVLSVSERGDVFPDAQVRLADLGDSLPSVGSHQLYIFSLRGTAGVSRDLYAYAVHGGVKRTELARRAVPCT
ncbi:MAG: hypothetical protein AB2L07_15985 [Thermoanaerobaculaceae bacterium]